MKKVLYISLATILVLGGSGVLLANPADAATPADTLYPLDLAMESAQRLLTRDPIAKAELELDILEERTAELEDISEVLGASDENIEKALDAIDSQSDRVQLRVDQLNNQEGLEDAALEQVQNRYEKQVETHTATMNQVKSTVENMGEDTQQKLETAVDNMEKGQSNSADSYNEKKASDNGSSSNTGNGNN